MKASNNDAIVVGLDPDNAAEGRPCFNSETYPDPEEPYFNQALKEVEAKYCVDRSKLFVEGFSSGSWLTNLIGCVDGDVIRGQGNASGCMQGAHPTCKGPVAYIAGHDKADPANSYQCGSDNRDRMVKLNGCSTDTEPYDPGPDVKAPQGSTISCVQYKNCMPGYPVVWCTTTGLGHNDQVGTGLSTFGFWKFWMSLPSAAATPAAP
jgi:poly(3-hydroxybutyrate) depolymerase